MNYYIYKTTRLSTGEWYIGRRGYCGDIHKDTYCGSGSLFRSKYDYDKSDWVKVILMECRDMEHSMEMEVYAIGNHWKSNDMCLNLVPGGSGQGGKRSKEFSREASKWMRGNSNSAGAIRSKEFKANMSGDRNVSRRPDVRQKLRDVKLGDKNPARDPKWNVKRQCSHCGAMIGWNFNRHHGDNCKLWVAHTYG